MEKRRVVMRIGKFILWVVFIGFVFFGMLFLIERTSIVAEEPVTVQERISQFERMREVGPKKEAEMRKKAVARIRTFQKRFRPKRIPPPEIETLLKELDVKTVVEAIQKVKGLDDLLEEFEAKNPEEALKRLENTMEKIEKILEAIAIAVDLDVEFEEEKPIAITNKILERIYQLKSISKQLMEMSPKIAQYTGVLETLLQGVIDAKYTRDWYKIWDAIPNDMPVNPLVKHRLPAQEA